LLVSEAVLLALAGSILGLALVYMGLALGAPAIESAYGIFLGGLTPGLYDLAILGIVSGAALVLGCIPAWRAYRNSLADGLTIRV
jgi:putative ABC transport system permease protein